MNLQEFEKMQLARITERLGLDPIKTEMTDVEFLLQMTEAEILRITQEELSCT